MQAHQLGKWQAVALLARFAWDPLGAVRNAHRVHGPFIKARMPTRPGKRRQRTFFVIADAELYKAMLSDTETWRNIEIITRSSRYPASQRLAKGMTTLRGARHEHYRKLIAPPLKRACGTGHGPPDGAYRSLSGRILAARYAVRLTNAARTWQIGWPLGLLFGDEREPPCLSPTCWRA